VGRAGGLPQWWATRTSAPRMHYSLPSQLYCRGRIRLKNQNRHPWKAFLCCRINYTVNLRYSSFHLCSNFRCQGEFSKLTNVNRILIRCSNSRKVGALVAGLQQIQCTRCRRLLNSIIVEIPAVKFAIKREISWKTLVD